MQMRLGITGVCCLAKMSFGLAPHLWSIVSNCKHAFFPSM